MKKLPILLLAVACLMTACTTKPTETTDESTSTNVISSEEQGEVSEQSDLIEQAEALIGEEKCDEAVALLEKGMESGDHRCLEGLGYMYMEEVFNVYDITKATELFEKGVSECKSGTCYAYLGDLNLYEEYGIKDYDKAEEYYLKSIELGYDDSYGQLAYMYSDEQYNRYDIDKAIEWAEKGSEVGNHYSVETLAYIYLYMKSDTESYDKAEKLFTKYSAECDSGYCFSSLGLLYFDDSFGMVDYDKSEEYCLKAAELGDTQAMNHLGFMYAYEEYGRYAPAKAIEWCEKGAELGDTYCMITLGEFALRGIADFNDYTKAEEVLLAAAEDEQYGSTALYWLGVLYGDEKYGMQDEAKSTEYFAASLEIVQEYDDDVIDKQYILGKMYLYGQGVEQDIELAEKYLNAYVETTGSINDISEDLEYLKTLKG